MWKKIVSSTIYNDIFDMKKSVLYQDMTLPLSSYYMASSHNTYLEGDQVWIYKLNVHVWIYMYEWICVDCICVYTCNTYLYVHLFIYIHIICINKLRHIISICIYIHSKDINV